MENWSTLWWLSSVKSSQDWKTVKLWEQKKDRKEVISDIDREYRREEKKRKKVSQIGKSKKRGGGREKRYIVRERERERERERWLAQEHQIGAKKLWGRWPFMRPLEASVSTQIGLTLSSGPSVLARMLLSLSLCLNLCGICYFGCHVLRCFLTWVLSIFSCRRVRGGNGCKVGDDNSSL